MRRKIILIGALTGLAVVTSQSVDGQPGQPDKPAPAAPARADDEAAIRANVAAFVRAYNARDAKAVANLFALDGLITHKNESTAEGRAAIEENFKELFDANPQKRLEVSVESIRFAGKDLAVEVGSTKETAVPGGAAEYDRYTVVHVKREGKWQMALARDEEGPSAGNRDELRQLAWLVGDWIDDGGRVVVSSKCRWSDDGQYLLQSFTLQVEGRDTMRVTQRIGWDPLAKRIRSWVFDSEGGFGESTWTRNGTGWVIKATGVRPDGTTASATNLLVPAGKDAYVWRSTDRVVGDRVEAPNEVKVIRTPPRPKQ